MAEKLRRVPLITLRQAQNRYVMTRSAIPAFKDCQVIAVRKGGSYPTTAEVKHKDGTREIVEIVDARNR